jgi:hypothetical protein
LGKEEVSFAFRQTATHLSALEPEIERAKERAKERERKRERVRERDYEDRYFHNRGSMASP